MSGGVDRLAYYVRQRVGREDSEMSDNSILQPGTTAPAFTLKSAPNKTLSLDELRGRPVGCSVTQLRRV